MKPLLEAALRVLLETKCHCGQPLHYSTADALAFMLRIVAEHGEYFDVTVGGRTWRVQRHYVALHGIAGADLHTLGFEEIT